MRRTALRFCALSKKRTFLGGSFSPEAVSSRAKGTIFMSEVRNKLRSIVGVGTNWSDHLDSMEERKLLHSLLPKSQKELCPRRMKDSYTEVILPLGSQPLLREKYLTIYNTVRFGRILEDLDSLGVLISYTHTRINNNKVSPFSIVTAMVDRIDLCKTIISPESDIKFIGHVSWVGKTSMEVRMHMLQLHNMVYSPVLDATFVMVARDPENKGPAFINPLVPEGEEEEELFRQGALNKVRRTAFSNTSLLKMAPTAEERNAIHEMFLSTLDTRTVSFQSRVLPPDSEWMGNTKLKSLDICHPEERNIFNRVFGGFLMRKAFELAWATAVNFGGSRPFIVAVDDIMFQRPVSVGSLLFLSSQVCFTEKNYIQVRVQSEIASVSNREHHTTNVFHFTFIADKEVPLVIPRTYGESMLYLDGKRHFMATKQGSTGQMEDYSVAP